MTGSSPWGVVILAAGLGKRMRSDKAKVLHEISGRAMVGYVTEAAAEVVGSQIVVVVGHQAGRVRETVSASVATPVQFALQQQQLGTGHAVACGLPMLADHVEEVVILYGDVPLLRPATIRSLIEAHTADACELTVIAVELTNPTGYGRILKDDEGRLTGIVEESDASVEQKAIRWINTGIYCVRRGFLHDALPMLSAENAQGEYYLTDIVKIGHRQHRRMGILPVADAEETAGVNSLEDLENVQQILDRRRGR